MAVVPTGSLGLDLALGVGGLPRGRVVEIFGPESSGKTTLALHAIAEVQKQGGVAAFIDAEHALDVTYARRLGVNLSDLLVSQPDTGEQALEIAEQLVRSGRRRPGGGRLGGGAGAQGRDRGRDGRRAHGAAGAPHEPGAAQAHRGGGAQPGPGHLHQPDPDEDRRGLRQPRDHHRRPRAQVLRLGAARHPAHRAGEGGRAGGGEPHPRQGGEEQGGAAVPRGRVRHPLRRRAWTGSPRRSTWPVERGILEKSGAHYTLDGERIAQGRERAAEWLRANPEAFERVAERLQAAQAAAGPEAPVPPVPPEEEAA